ncbi:hypothetical protein HJC23_006404 [Cyclotella cryptica]|uniref:Cytochrome c-552/DMSO reductase-like haem-binding domain-containing protein n=1 Tax=Cyclotella cryptica TaxID=29204 RepID=A0ABD3QUW6_9STRA
MEREKEERDGYDGRQGLISIIYDETCRETSSSRCRFQQEVSTSFVCDELRRLWYNTKLYFLPCSLSALLSTGPHSRSTSVESITCVPVTTAPTIDGDTSDWSSVESFEAPLTGALTPTEYPYGNATIQCVYDDERVYFLFEVAGPYRFDAADKHKCAAISTMFKMGSEAMLYDMGNCPLAKTSCPTNLTECDDYKVDIGAHWELATTEMGVAYGTSNGSGKDNVAGKDDEYAVSPSCRMDDNDANAANEWEGAWTHTSPNSTDGSYIFEMSRMLSTASTESDAQLEAGKATDFGFAIWDPFESESNGWSDAGHYVTGCSADWISLRLVDESGNVEDDTSTETSSDSPETSSSGIIFDSRMLSLSLVVLGYAL